MDERPTLIVKIGGSVADSLQNVAKDIATLTSIYTIIIVHGCSAQMNELCRKMGLTPKFITSPSGFKSRYTDAETLVVYNLAVCVASTNVILALRREGVNAVRLNGLDGASIIAKQKIVYHIDEQGKEKLIRDDFTGKIEKINIQLLTLLLKNNYVPVIGALAIGENNQPLNVDGDRLAAAIGIATKGSTIISLTDVDGYYEEGTIVPSLSLEEVFKAIKKAGGGRESGGMKKKLYACAEALQGGVKEFIIGNGRLQNPISNLLAGAGTHCRI
ncbi:MAG: [LysW]-aminoadipate kinase [Candidatus Anstonellales archaeon]